MKQRSTAAFCLLVLAACSAEAEAQPSNSRLTALSLDELGAVQVTSVSKQPEQVWQTGVAVYVITREDIRRSGLTSIPEILRLAPGIEVARIDSDHWAVGVRGFGDQFSKSLLVLVDGRSIYTPLFAGMYWPAQDTLIEDIERIEVIRGPGGTIWGANAVNGVINIITRGAADTRGLLVSAGSGTLDRAAAVRYGAAISDTADYRVYAKGVKRAPQFHPDGGDFDAWWTTQAGFRTDWMRGSRDQVTLQGDVSRGDHGQRVAVASFSPPSQQALDGVLEAAGANLLGRWQRQSGDGGGFQLQAYWDRTAWTAPHFAETRNTFDIDFVGNRPFAARHALTWGGGARHSPSLFAQTLSTLDFSPRRHTDNILSAFLQDEVQVVRNRLWITAGSKLEHNNYTGLEVQPGIRLLWMPLPGHTLWSAVTRAVRTPSRIERGVRATSFATMSGAMPVYLEVVGNEDFDAERLLGYETGYRTLVASSFYLDVAAFHNEHKDLSSFGLSTVTLEREPLPVHALVRFPYVNGVEGTSDGFEVSPDWWPAGWMQLKGSYSFIRFDLATTPASVDVNAVARYEGSSPHHQVRLQGHVVLPRAAEIDLGYRYVSALPARRVGAYHNANVRLGVALTNGLDLSISGENLLQPHHAEFSPVVGITRTVYAGVIWRLFPGRR